MGRVVRHFLSWGLGAFFACSVAAAETRAVGFTNLVVRLQADSIGFAGGKYRVHVLETLREGQVNAVGAENLVFEKDESSRAEILLGGTAKELECEKKIRTVSCRLAIEWQVLDVATDQIVYQALLRSVERDVDVEATEGLGVKLVKSQARALLARPKFREALARPVNAPGTARYPQAGFRACETTAAPMPDGFKQAAAATVIVRAGTGFGSGFFLGPDGLVVTAEHAVVSSDLRLELYDGTELRAKPVRVSKQQDAALLVVEGKSGPFPCLPIEPGPKAIGRDVYAIGAPASKQLAFSLTRGIISATRTIDGTTLLQTDTAMSPGNSGGPLVDAEGRIVGIVSRKFTGQAIEGLGFGVPIEAALEALSLSAATTTSAELGRAPALGFTRTTQGPLVVDVEDPAPSLDPARDAAQKEQAEQREERAQIDRLTPRFIPIMRWGGLLVAGGGLLAAYGTAREVDPDMKRSDYEAARLRNDLSWVAVGAGGLSFAASFLFTPSVPKKKAALWQGVVVEPEGRGARIRVSY
jgi:S1-C subfamily serine protease